MFYAVEVSKPSLGWQLTCKAAELCHALGYHRAMPGSPGQAVALDAGRRQLLFWNVYIMDSTLALRLGRPSVMREWDITLDRNIGPDVIPQPWDSITGFWIRHAEIQNRMYKLLYSPIALSRTPEEQEICARSLAQELVDLTMDVGAVHDAAMAMPSSSEAATPAKGKITGMNDMHPYVDKISIYTTLTLAYRAIPAPHESPSRFCPECVDAARYSIVLHQQAMELLKPDAYFQAIYIHW